MDAVIVAVGHSEFINFNKDNIDGLYCKTASKSRVLIDVKGIFDKKIYESLGYKYFRL